MEFFIALFGIIYYSVRMCRSSDFKKRSEKVNTSRESYNKTLGNMVIASRDLEAKIENIICSKFRNGTEFDNIKDNLISVFGDEYKQKFIISLSCKRTDVKVSSGYWAKQLMLSKLGKVGILEYYNGYPVGVGNEVDINIMICEQIEKNLRDANTGLKLVLQPSIRNDSLRLIPHGKTMVFEHMVCCNEQDRQYIRLW